MLEAVLGNREQKLGRRAEAARKADQHLDLIFTPIVFLTEELGQREHALRRRRRRIVEEERHHLVDHVAEEILDRRLVAPETDRGYERETADVARTERRHFRGHPTAERLADDVRPLDPERVDDVEGMQEEVELIVEIL